MCEVHGVDMTWVATGTTLDDNTKAIFLDMGCFEPLEQSGHRTQSPPLVLPTHAEHAEDSAHSTPQAHFMDPTPFRLYQAGCMAYCMNQFGGLVEPFLSRSGTVWFTLNSRLVRP